MPKKKLLILYNKLLHYRMPIFNLLAEKYDLTVAYNFGGEPDVPLNFKRIKLTPKKLWKFTLQKENIFKLCQGFDAVLCYGETAYLKYSMLALHPGRKFKLVYWSIGAPASYSRKYGEGGRIYFAVGDFFTRRADAQVSYADPGRLLHIGRGFKPEMLFVANNTVEVPRLPFSEQRDRIMFIGTLYPQKGLPVLLEAYKKAYEANPRVLPLSIVGDGILKEEISQWVRDNHLEGKITLHGALYTAEEKSQVFTKAYACISPNQAGLGVLESMGYGVPFITHKDAITGGEAFNIEHGVSGLRLDTLDGLSGIILDISNTPGKYVEMGRKAYEHYWTKRRPQDMAAGLIEAVEYALSKAKPK